VLSRAPAQEGRRLMRNRAAALSRGQRDPPQPRTRNGLGNVAGLQVQLAFTHALELEGLLERVDAHQAQLADPTVDDPARPVLLAVSDNGPQMTSGSTREFLAMCAIAQHFGRPGTPQDQAWIESLFSHIKADWPHLELVRDPAVLRAELASLRREYNTQRLHAGIGYVTPDDEHEGRGPAIRHARRAGLHRARRLRIAYHRAQRESRDAGRRPPRAGLLPLTSASAKRSRAVQDSPTGPSCARRAAVPLTARRSEATHTIQPPPRQPPDAD
jgi:hypothetical protein